MAEPNTIKNSETSVQKEDETIKNFTIKTSRVDIHANSPVGFLGFAFACFLTGVSFTKITDYTSTHLSEYFFFGGFCQFFIGIFDWYRRNPKYNIADARSKKSSGMFNVGMSILTLSDFIDALPGGKINLFNQIIVFISFVLGTINSFKPNDDLTKAIGYIYFLITAVTLYIYFALQLMFIYGHKILPLLEKNEKIICSFK